MTRLPPLDPAVAQTRHALRATLRGLQRQSNGEQSNGEQSNDTQSALVLVALSGGADSLALAAAAAFEAPKLALTAGAVVIDHGLQTGSAEIAERAAEQARALGLTPVIVRRVTVHAAHPDGPEAAAREARYAELERVRAEVGAELLLTAHTRNDQAEQVLLALARGSGSRAISGIPPRRGPIHRPFLAIDRATTVRACEAQQLEVWVDPHNLDPSYTRVRVRERVLPVLEKELGAGIRAGLARSADLAREDADALDQLADQLTAELAGETAAPEQPEARLSAQRLAELPAALRQRVIRRVAAVFLGERLSREHTLTVAALVTNWHGQGPIDLPGGWATRDGGEVVFVSRRSTAQ